MFCKLKLPFVTPLYVTTNGMQTFTGVEGKGIEYKKIWSPDEKLLYSILPSRYHKDFHLTVMNINCDLLPHTDPDLISTLNFYIRTDNCKTIFYDELIEGPKKFHIGSTNIRTDSCKITEKLLENQKEGYIYNKSELIEVGSFIAKPNEIWLLDVKKIHSVEALGEFSLRTAVTLGTYKHNYENVYEMLKETGAV